MKIKEKQQAIKFRTKGFSLKEISRRLKVSKSTVSIWVRDIKLNSKALSRLLKKIKLGQFISASNKRAKIKAIEKNYLELAHTEINSLEINKKFYKLLCAIMYWCEGTKNARTGVCFINSDSDVIKRFLELLRGAFTINEKKFRSCIHLHSYHSPARQLAFWSKVTNINKRQFIRPYLKPHSGKRIHENYQGCISVKYHSNDLARRVMALAKAFLGA